MHKIRMAFAVAGVGFTVLAGGRAPAEAAPFSATPLTSVAQQVADQTGGGAVQTVHWRRGFCWRHPGHWRCRKVRIHGYCARWRSECADRWGWHTPRYRWCLRRHGC